MLLFLARTGARVSEAISVNVGDFIDDWPSQVLLRGKGGKQRIVPLAKDTASVLRDLVRERPVLSQPEAPVFVNARGQRRSSKSFSGRLEMTLLLPVADLCLRPIQNRSFIVTQILL